MDRWPLCVCAVGDQRPSRRLCLWLASPGSCLFPEPGLGLHCTADFLWDCERKTRFSCRVPYGFLSFPRPSEHSEPEAGTALRFIPVIVVQNSSPPGKMSRGSLRSLNAQLHRRTDAKTHSCTNTQPHSIRMHSNCPHVTLLLSTSGSPSNHFVAHLCTHAPSPPLDPRFLSLLPIAEHVFQTMAEFC